MRHYFISALLLVGFCGCLEHTEKVNIAPNPYRLQLAQPREISAETLTQVQNYITTTRGWNPESYQLEFLDERDGLLYIYVGYKLEAKNTNMLGSDKTFYVGFDEGRMTVTNEGKLQ